MNAELETAHHKNKKFAVYAGYAAIGISCLLILIKSIAYFESGSASILSSLTDSVVDSVVSLMALASIYYAQRPADEDHRWGHGKMEAVSALFQAAMIAGGGVFLVMEAISRFIIPVPVSHQMLGIAVMIVSIILSIILVAIQRYALAKTDSLAVEADSAHYGSDIIINGGVLVILLLSYYGAPHWIDPLFALGVAAFLGKLSFEIASKAMNMLMDRELPTEDREKIIEIITGQEGVLDMHDLRTYRSGPAVVMTFDIEVDEDLLLKDAHAIALKVEKKLLALHPGAEILIHVDPAGSPEDSRHRIKGVHH
ncbi:MAG: cation diffusion facilitator family transporter [Alphaproteobacteria bacterium]|nr:cation diffusion facilitator family transporter [Alphaproteobacteria bacterium]